jgi:membrane protein
LSDDTLPNSLQWLAQVVNFAVSFAVISALFAMIFKLLPDVRMSWNDVWLGAIVTAVLFTIGKLAIGLYLGHSSMASSYGVAGSFVVLLVWTYYSAQILFFGAELTQVYANTYGSRIVPTENAEPLQEVIAKTKEDHTRNDADGRFGLARVFVALTGQEDDD